jgi:hypothetical protein
MNTIKTDLIVAITFDDKERANYYSKENLILPYCKLTKLTKKLL